MRVFFSGSARHSEGARTTSLPDPLRQAARQIGHAVALRGHTLLVTTEKGSAIDPFIVEGAQKLGALAIRPVVELHRMNGRPTAYVSANGVRMQRVGYDHPPFSDDKSLGARGGAVSAADAVVALGGSDSTRAVIRLAMRLNKPIVPLGCFGGAAAEALALWDARWFRLPGFAERAAVLAGEWRGEPSAESVANLIGLVAGRHEYHLSCAPTDAAAGDHMEALLTRFGRRVQRLERYVGLTEAAVLAEQVAAADTLVMLWSRGAMLDPRCTLERDAAARVLGLPGGSLRRVIAVCADPAAPPAPVSAEALVAHSRQDRELAAWRIVSGEGAA